MLCTCSFVNQASRGLLLECRGVFISWRLTLWSWSVFCVYWQPHWFPFSFFKSLMRKIAFIDFQMFNRFCVPEISLICLLCMTELCWEFLYKYLWWVLIFSCPYLWKCLAGLGIWIMLTSTATWEKNMVSFCFMEGVWGNWYHFCPRCSLESSSLIT